MEYILSQNNGNNFFFRSYELLFKYQKLVKQPCMSKLDCEISQRLTTTGVMLFSNVEVTKLPRKRRTVPSKIRIRSSQSAKVYPTYASFGLSLN